MINVKDRKNAQYFQTKHKPAKAWMAWLCAMLVLPFIIALILGILSSTVRIPSFIVCLCIVIVYLVLNCCFDWIKSPTLYEYGGKLYYGYTSIMDMLGHTDADIQLKNITKIRRRYRSLIVYGDIVRKEPLTKSKNLSRYVIQYCPREIDDILRERFKL